jgi:hypothetical protein
VPAAIDAGDGTTPLENLAIASNLFGRAAAVWQAVGKENRFSLRGPGPGAPWSAPKPVDGVPADASALDLAVDDTGRVAYVWELGTGFNVSQLSISTYGAEAAAPEPPAQPGPAPSPAPPSGGGSSSSKPLTAKVSGKATSARGVTFSLTAPAAGTATITSKIPGTKTLHIAFKVAR